MKATDYLRDNRWNILGIALPMLGSLGAGAAIAAGVDAIRSNAAVFAAFGVVCYAFGLVSGQAIYRLAHRGPSLAELCTPLSERCRAMLLQALDTGDVVAYYEADSDACYLVDKGLLEAPSVYSPVIPVKLHIAPGRYEELSRRRDELLGDIPERRRKKLIG